MAGGKLAGWLAGVLAIGAFGALTWAERRRALRADVEPKERRVARNLVVAAVSAAAVQVAERPIVRPLARWVERRRIGVLHRLPLPSWLRTAFAVVLMDYTLYWWHVAEHRVPWLWRCHAVHHVDLDLDASTALRFHFTELVASVPWRAAQVTVIGVTPSALVLWQRLLMLSILFHHSNVRLPIGVERWLGHLVVTPRLHGIHHSIVEEETNSNWSSGLTLWDRLHGTLKGNVPQQEITIGLPAYRDPDEVTLPRILVMPFTDHRALEELPSGGVPAREPTSVPDERLLA